ncbi:MAG: LuxR family transcriptional regulator [Eggerthellales bacterium]|nr:LuxR family transcriptional regulator [Eggerthellales bacterium]
MDIQDNTTLQNASHQEFFDWRIATQNTLLWLGFAAFLAWANMLICFEGALRGPGEYSAGIIREPVVLSALAASAVILLGSFLSSHPSLTKPPVGRPSSRKTGAFPEPVRFVLKSPLCTLAAGMLAAILSALSALGSSGIIPFGFATAVFCGIGIGCALAVFILTWGCLFGSFDIRQVVPIMSLALCLQWLPMIPIEPLPDSVRAVLMAALPMLSCLCLVSRNRQRHDATESSRPESQPVERVPLALLRISLTMMACAGVVQFVWAFFIWMTPEHLDTGMFPPLFVAIFMLSAALLFAVLNLMQSSQSYRIELLYRTVFFLSICAIGVLPLASEYLLASYIVVYAAYSFMVPTMWLMALGYCTMTGRHPLAVFGAVFAGQNVGLIIGYLVAKGLETYFGSGSGTQVLGYVFLGALALLTIVYVAVLPERTLLMLSPHLFGLSHESLTARCNELAKAFGLSRREEEVLVLLARGRDVEYIENELYISRNTVNSHRKNIYKKMHVHSRQELLSLIDGEAS